MLNIRSIIIGQLCIRSIIILEAAIHRCSLNYVFFRNIHWKTPVLESLFDNVSKRLQNRFYPVNIAKFLKTTSNDVLLMSLLFRSA